MQPPASPTPAFEPLQAGDPPVIGGYRVLARLGAGGMGRVYLAATQSGRRLAVKVVRAEFADDPEFRRRFQQEIVAAQRVQSLYTAPVIDADPDGPHPWMATAHVPGPSLARAVAEYGPMPAATVRTLFAGIAEALQAIHAAGVIHRDLKPSNVLLAADGPRVIDFGIARAADATPLTRTGMRIGSPQFMSPEQALGRASTPAIDVFALGSVAFYAATGRTPFGDGPDTAVLFRIAHQEPNLDGCPADLRPLVERCLAKDPAERPSAREVLAALEVDGGVPAPDWLPADVTHALPAYQAPPPTPRPVTTTVPPQRGSHQPYVPPARPPANNRGLLIALGAGAFAVLAVVVLVVALTSGGGKPIDPADPSPRQISSQPATQPSAAGTGETPTPSDPAGAKPPAGTKPVGGEIGRHTGINLTEGYGLSFTEDPKHPRQSYYTSDGADLDYSNETLGGDRLSVLSPGQAGTYEACRDNTRYASSLDSDYLVKGKLICVTTSSGLIGPVKITGSGDKPDDYLTLDLTVWQGVAPTPTG